MKLKWNRMLVLPLLIAVVGVWLLWPHSNPKAGWFDDNWIYRVAISIGNTGSADSDKKVKLDIDTAALITANKIQSDCGDSRFTDATGKLLKYYIDSAGGACNTNSTDYYVLMESIPVGGSIIYHYYGNTTAANGTEAAQFSQATFSPNSGPTAASEEQTTGPVLSWSMNENAGSTLNDNTLNANTGTLGTTTSAPTWTTSDLCVEGSCLKFDGTNDYVSKTYSSDTELNPGTAGFSVNAWFKHSSIQAGTDVIVSRVDGADANGIGYKIYMDSSGFICFGIDQTAGSFPVDSACSTTSYADSKWHQVSGVKNGTTSIILYIDGQQIAADTSITSTTISGSSPAIRVGIDNGFTNPWDGFIDAVKVYPYALTADQVKTGFTARGSVKGVGVSFGNSDMNKNLSNGLVGYWKMDENTGTSTTNVINSYTSGTLNTGTTWTTGKFGTGLQFDGTDDDVSIGTSTVLDFTQNMTISAWIYPTGWGEANYGTIFSRQSGSLQGYQFEISNSGGEQSLTLYNGNSSCTALSSAITLNQWQHVAVVLSSNVATFYVNSSVASVLCNFTLASNGSTAAYIGSWDGNADTFKGSIDELRAYNRALSPSEITALYNFAPGPVGYWKMDEGSGTSSINDSSGNNTTGTMNGSMTQNDWVPGKVGDGLDFDGSNDYILFTNPSVLSNLPPNNFSASAWIKLNALPSSNTGYVIAGKSRNDDHIWHFSIDNISGTNYFNASLKNNAISRSTGVSAGVWYHFYITYNNSTDRKIHMYINGVEVSYTTQSAFSGTYGTDATYDSNNDVAIGAHKNNNGYFNGIIDDVKIYNYVRTPGQVVEDMNGGHPIGGSPVGSQAGYWKFDEGALNTCSGGTNDFCDSSINTNDLAFSGTAGGITLSGKFNKAFDGNAARWASRADDDDFDFAAADDFTLSAWIKTDGTASGTQYILNKSSATSQGYGIYGSSSGKVVFAIDDDTSWTPDDQVQSTTNVFDQAWHYIAARKTGTSKIDIFVDGRLEGSDTSLGATGSLSNAVALYIGDRDGTDNGDEFNGDVDEVKIYRGALTDDQIKLDYNRGATAVLGSTSTASDGITADNSGSREYCVPGDTSTCTPPIGEWKFDESTGSTGYDTSGNNLNVTFNGASAMTQSNWVTGKIGDGLYFDGSNDAVDMTDTNGTLAPTSITVSAWVKFDVLSSAKETQRIVRKLCSSGVCINNSSYYLELNTSNDTVRFYVHLGGVLVYVRNPLDSIVTNKWYYLVGTYDAATSTQKIYINGVDVTAFRSSAGTGNIQGDSGTVFRIGSSTTAANRTQGIIDHVRIYDYARSAAQIAWDYNHGGPVAHYKLDECSGTTAYNSVLDGNGQAAGNNGTITIGATGSNTSAGTCTGAATEAWKNGANGKFGSSLDFDGTDDYITTSAMSPSAGVGVTYPSGSWGGWFYPKTSAASKTLMEKATEFRITTDSSSNAICGIYYSGAFHDASSVTAALSLNTWNHVLCTTDGTNIKTYLNGRLVNTTADNHSIISTSSILYIAENSSSAQRFKGQIDNIRIYNYPLTSTQVVNLYSENAAALFAPITGSP